MSRDFFLLRVRDRSFFEIGGADGIEGGGGNEKKTGLKGGAIQKNIVCKGGSLKKLR